MANAHMSAQLLLCGRVRSVGTVWIESAGSYIAVSLIDFIFLKFLFHFSTYIEIFQCIWEYLVLVKCMGVHGVWFDIPASISTGQYHFAMGL